MEEMAAQINRCIGPSGPNREYVIELARALRGLGLRMSMFLRLRGGC